MFPVRFNLTVTSVKEFTVEANKLEKRNPIQADAIEGRRPIPLAVGTPPPIAPQKWTRGKGRKIADPPDVGTVPVAV